MKNEDKLKMNRREFFVAAVAGFGGLVSNKFKDDVVGKIYESSKEFAKAEHTKFNRSDIITEILFGFEKGRIALATEGVDPNSGLVSHSNEIVAYNTMRSFFGDADITFDGSYKEYKPDSSSIISVGGPGTNLHARDVFGLPQNKREKVNYYARFKGIGNPIRFPYSMARIDEDGPCRLQDGKEHQSYRYVVTQFDSDEIFKPLTKSGYLIDDYLILSRIPIADGKYMVLFSALHGPGIRGIRNVLTSLSANNLDALYEVYKKQPHHGFQALFRCSDFFEELDDTGVKSHAPASVELVPGSAKNVVFSM